MSDSNEVAIAKPTGALAERMTYAQTLAASDLLPEAYRRKPQNVLLAMEYGHALGLDTVTAIQQVNVINGKPTASAQLIGTLVRRAGHRLRVTGDAQHATAEIVRKDDPDFIFRAEWTIARATAAGLAGKGPWKTYPEAMLKARAITEVARDACPEALAGVAYTAEELSDGSPDTEAWAHASEPETIDAEVVEEPHHDEPATAEQLKAIGTLLTKCDVKDSDERHAIASMIVEREVASAKELTKREAHSVIDTLKPFAESDDPVAALNEWLNEE